MTLFAEMQPGRLSSMAKFPNMMVLSITRMVMMLILVIHEIVAKVGSVRSKSHKLQATCHCAESSKFGFVVECLGFWGNF